MLANRQYSVGANPRRGLWPESASPAHLQPAYACRLQAVVGVVRNSVGEESLTNGVLSGDLWVQRGIGVTLKASSRLLSGLDVVKARARELSAGPAGETVGRVLERQGIGEIGRGELRMVEAALEENLDPMALDDAFYQLALEGRLVHRAFARAFTLAPGPRSLAGGGR